MDLIMANISIDDVVYEDILNNLDVLSNILQELKSDESINNLKDILEDYINLKTMLKYNQQSILDMEILAINGTLESSRIYENKDILKIFTELKEKIEITRNNFNTNANAINSKENNINTFTTNINRLDEIISFTQVLKEQLQENIN
jgi:hypothetical protein